MASFLEMSIFFVWCVNNRQSYPRTLRSCSNLSCLQLDTIYSHKFHSQTLQPFANPTPTSGHSRTTINYRLNRATCFPWDDRLVCIFSVQQLLLTIISWSIRHCNLLKEGEFCVYRRTLRCYSAKKSLVIHWLYFCSRTKKIG